MSITVIARAKVKRGCEEEMENAVRAILGPTRAEEGCLRYSVYRSVEDAQLYTTVEEWASKEASDRHMSSAHIQELFKKLSGLVSAAPEIQMFKDI